MEPRYPIYVISKGRWESRLTSKFFDSTNIPYRIVIEPQEFDQYASVVNTKKILVLPFSNLGQGSIPARNWVWEHSISEGHARHWIIDDNIQAFYRFNKNIQVKVDSGTIFRVAEDFVERYTNVPMAGFEYHGFVDKRVKVPPFRLNARIYSCTLLDNKCKHRWRGRYNEDTDLSIRILKDGDCTILFRAFLAHKVATMTLKGGNTDELYKQDSNFDGRLEMARHLQRQHPELVKITRKWGRWQHHVDYRPFKNNKLIKKPEYKDVSGVNNYGMELKVK